MGKKLDTIWLFLHIVSEEKSIYWPDTDDIEILTKKGLIAEVGEGFYAPTIKGQWFAQYLACELEGVQNEMGQSK